MRIMFHVASLSGGGAERVMVTLASAFVERGEDVMILCRDNTPSAYHISPTVRVDNLQDHLPPYTGGLINKVIRRIRFNREYIKIVRSFCPDVNIVFTAPYAILVLPILIKLGIPVICSEHSTVTRRYPDRKVMVRRHKLYKRVDAVTVLTRYDYALWRNKPNVVRMPNPYVAKEFICNKRDKIVLAAGRVNEWRIKGFDLIIKSWSSLWREFPEWKLVIAGKYDQESLAYLKALLNETDCEHVDFPGFCGNLNEMMSRSEVFCLSSRLEGMPMVLLEAMDAGCACVANDCITGPSEIIRDGVNGLLARCDDPNDLTCKLREIMQSSELRTKFRTNAHLTLRYYSEELIIKRWYILFDKILAKK